MLASQLECKLRIDTLFKRKRFKQREIDLKFLLKSKQQPWNRSRIYAVGEGGAGKTSMCKGLIGKPFSESEESTTGCSSLTLNISKTGIKIGGESRRR